MDGLKKYGLWNIWMLEAIAVSCHLNLDTEFWVMGGLTSIYFNHRAKWDVKHVRPFALEAQY